MSSVKVVNETEQDIVLNGGTAGIFVTLMTIPRGKVRILKVDPNDTFREYEVKLHPVSQKNQAIFLTSDEFAELEKVVIKYDSNTDTLSYVVTKKKESGNNAAAGTRNRQGSPVGRFPKFISWLWGKKVTAGSGGGDGGRSRGRGDGGGRGGRGGSRLGVEC